MAGSLRLPVELDRVEIRPFTDANVDAPWFSCADADLDDFFRTDARRLEQRNTVRTYVGLYDSRLVSFVALVNDAVHLKTNEKKRLELEHDDHPVVPALKVARLAVSLDFRTRYRGMGEALVRFAYLMGTKIGKQSGCRLLTVDAYPDSLKFYTGLGFILNKHETYSKNKYPSMRLDLFGESSPAWL